MSEHVESQPPSQSGPGLTQTGSSATTPPPGAIVPRAATEGPQPGTVLPSHYAFCYGCGEDHPAGLHLKVTVGEGCSVTGEFVVDVNHQGAPGLAHGGLLAAALDETLGALNWLLLNPAVTARLEVDFRRPVPLDSRLFLSARVVGVHGRKVYSAATAHLDRTDGPIALAATALFVQVPLEHFSKHGRIDHDHQARSRADAAAGKPWVEINP